MFNTVEFVVEFVVEFDLQEKASTLKLAQLYYGILVQWAMVIRHKFGRHTSILSFVNLQKRYSVLVYKLNLCKTINGPLIIN